MESLLIKGGVPLHGEVTIGGAKNAVLPILAATLLTAEPCVIRRVPNLSDVKFMGQILTWLGAQVRTEGNTIRVQAKKIKGAGDYDLIRKMRGSICIMGPLLGRLKKATVSLPGGCVIGARPINLHLKGFRELGARVTIERGYVHASAKRLIGSALFLGGRAGSTVLGTANVMMAATLAEGVTVIESAACEPEVVDLANFLNAMGAKITGAGSPTLTVTGVKELHGAEHEVIPDRIEAATYAIAAAVTNGEITLRGARADQMHAVLDKLTDAGMRIERNGSAVTIRRKGRLKPVDITSPREHEEEQLIGPNDGADGAHARHQHHHRKNFRIALYACQRTGSAGSGYRDRRPQRDCQRGQTAQRGAGDGKRSEGLGGVDPRRPGGAWDHPG